MREEDKKRESRRTPLGPRFREALGFAVEAHAGDPRKGVRVPCVSHLLAVASLVLEMEASEDEAIAALQHDVIEDVGVEQEAVIEERFGAEVAVVVHANTDTDERPKPPWLARKEAYIAAIGSKSPPALRVSIADKLHNAGSIRDDYDRYGDAIFDRFDSLDDGHFATKRDGVVWCYAALVDAFEQRRADLGLGGEAKLNDLARAVADLESVTAPPE